MSVIGLKVGPFRIVRSARVPGPGRWYVARGDGDEVLVRVVPPNGDEHRAVQHQFEVLRDIGDPRIPAPIGHFGIVPGASVGALAVRAATGASLSDAIALRGDESVVMTPGTLLDLLLEVGQALEHAHGRGRVHGHLDPDNVVLGPDGRLWIFGFGTGMEEDPHGAWISPEQARGAPATVETDQWALGALALGLVLGHPVWRGDHPLEEAAGGDLSALVDAVGEQWPALGRVLGRMTEPVAGDRYPSMTAARDDLVDLAQIAGGRSDRERLAALLCSRRGEADAPEEYDVAPAEQVESVDEFGGAGLRAREFPVGGAPTAVPFTDVDEAPVRPPSPPPPTRSRPPPLEPPPEVSEPDVEEPSIGSDRAAPPRVVSRDLSIVTLAPILAGLMVLLLIVWLIVHLV